MMVSVHTQRVGPALRWARAALLVVVAMMFGVTAHVSADGLLPGPTAFACLTTMLLVPSARLLGRPASAARIVVLLVAQQAFVHVFLSLTAGHSGGHGAPPEPAAVPPIPAAPANPAGRASLYDQLYADRPAAPPARITLPEPVQHLVADLSGHAPMAVAHLVAAAAVGLWLAYGERLLWTVLTLSAHAWHRLGRTLVAALADLRAALVASLLSHHLLRHSRSIADGWHAVRVPVEIAVASSVVRRGPPRLLPT